MTKEPQPDDATQEIDQALIALLSLLWEAAQTSPGKPWSLAKLRKRSGMYMSTLMRNMNALVSAGLVELVKRDDGSGSAELSAAGHDLCAAVFFQAPTGGMRTAG
jgi:DNA-binding IclR family transcriptional regulator